MLRTIDEGLDQAPLQAVAQAEEEDGNQRQAERGGICRTSKARPGEVHADDHHLAVGEVDDAHDAEDHRQAERHQAVDHAGQQSLGDRLGEREKEVGGHQVLSSRAKRRTSSPRADGMRSIATLRMTTRLKSVACRSSPAVGNTSGATADPGGNTTVGVALEVLQSRSLDVDVLTLGVELDRPADHDVLVDLDLAQRVHQRVRAWSTWRRARLAPRSASPRR